LNQSRKLTASFILLSSFTSVGIILLLLIIKSNLPWYALVLSNLGLLFLSGVYFLDYLKGVDFKPLSKSPEFWVIFGISASSILMIPVSLFILVLEGHLLESHFLLLASVNQLSFIFQYGAIIKAFLCIIQVQAK
jgi:hypothetical protein